MICNAHSLLVLRAQPYYAQQFSFLEDIINSNDADWRLLHCYDDQQFFWHYTDLPGLKGIIESRTLWFGHIKTMNDPNEFKYSIQLIKTIMEEKKTEYRNETIDKLFKYILEFVEGFGNETFNNWFIACFCEEGNQLSQWRAYSKNGAGVSLGFNFSDSTERSDNIDSGIIAQNFFRKVLYDKTKQKELINNFLLEVCNKILERNNPPIKIDLLHAMALEISNLLIDFSISFKDPAFSEEKEWRYIRKQLHNEVINKALFIATGNILRPILPTQFVDNPFEGSGQCLMPLKKIQLGPQLNEKILLQFIQSFITQERSKEHTIKLGEIEVLPPTFAYR